MRPDRGVTDPVSLPQCQQAGERRRRCPRRGQATSSSARCSTGSARSTGCPRGRPGRRPAAPSCTPRWSGSTGCRPRSECPPWRARCSRPAWPTCSAEAPEIGELFDGPDDQELAQWLESAGALLDGYFRLEDPRRLEPEACELLVEAELESGLLLRGYIDRLDVAPSGQIRVVDYKTGAAPREVAEARALFQMKFYALALLQLRGVVPTQLRLIYLADRESLTYQPDEVELRRFERTLDAMWRAILRAGKTGDFRPSPSRMCEWCSHRRDLPGLGRHPAALPGLAGARPTRGAPTRPCWTAPSR